MCIYHQLLNKMFWLTYNLHFVCIICAEIIGYGSISQPNLNLNSFGIISCCNTSNEFDSCVLSYTTSLSSNLSAIYRNDLDSSNRKNALLVSYTTNNILVYSLYSYFIHALYCEQNNYQLFVASPENGYEYDKNDQRWNKIKIISTLLNNAMFHYQHIVWMDADLIPLDFGMKIEEIIQLYSNNNDNDLIISKDIAHQNNGIANTGCMIIKNSEWSKSFFELWWNYYDRSLAMDQHVFDILYHKNELNAQDHIILLRSDAINSNFPFIINQKPYNQILHLAGMSNAYRKHAFQIAVHNICEAYGNNNNNNDHNNSANRHNNNEWIDPLPLQLGLDRETLANIDIISIQMNQLKEIISQLNNLKNSNDFHRKYDYDFICKIRSKLRDTRQT
eukprot:gene17691-24637_t